MFKPFRNSNMILDYPAMIGQDNLFLYNVVLNEGLALVITADNNKDMNGREFETLFVSPVSAHCIEFANGYNED